MAAMQIRLLPRFSRRDLQVTALLSAALAIGLLVRQPANAGDIDTTAPEIRDPRVCATLAVYQLGWGAGSDQRAHAAQQVLTAAPDLRRNCESGLGVALTRGISAALWQLSVDTVDAVTRAKSFNGTCSRGRVDPPCSGSTPAVGAASAGSVR
jgi:hypothetical protein